MAEKGLRERLVSAILSMQEKGEPVKGKEIQQDIHDAAVSGDDELKGLAGATAYMMIEPSFLVLARKQQNTAGAEAEDLMSGLKVYVYENIEEYDPEFSPVTWLQHRYLPVFKDVKEASYGIKKTKHEAWVEGLVSQAKTGLLESGHINPTEVEIYDYLVKNVDGVKGKVSMNAIIKAMRGFSMFPSGDTLLSVPDASHIPEKSLMDKARSEHLQAVVQKLSKRNREVILAEMAYNDEHGDMPSGEELEQVLKDVFPDASTEELQRYIFSAHNEMRRKYKAKETESAPVNMLGGEEQESLMEEEERAILEVLEEDASVFDFL